ncbi:hypothetical protein [Lutibacter sp.]
MKKIMISIAMLLALFTAKAQYSKIIGIWQLKTVIEEGTTLDDFETVFIFSENGILKAARSATEKPIEAGTWKYNEKQKAIVMASDLDKDFNGEAIVLKVNDTELSYKKNNAILYFNRLEKLDLPPEIEPAATIKPTLSYSYDDLLDEEGSFDFEGESAKLPWKIENVLNFLKDFNDIIYTVTSFREGSAPDSFLVSSRIVYNKEEQTVDVREYSFFQKDYIEMNEEFIPINEAANYQEKLYFFPKDKLDLFRVIGTEKVATLYGNVICTVVEGFGMFDDKIKYWMINEKPGVFAKIIIVKGEDPPFGYTKVYALKEIK